MKFPNSVPAENAGTLFYFGRLVALVLSLAGLLTGCIGGGEKADLVIINGAEPESLDPAIITGQPDMRVVKCRFEGLTRLDPREARPAPALAERWEMSPDGIRYTFHLRTNAVWSTGEPITSEDVVYSWRRALDPGTAADYAAQLFYIKNAEDYNAGRIKDPAAIGVSAVDRHTVAVELVGPTPFFLDLCAFPTLAVVPRLPWRSTVTGSSPPPSPAAATPRSTGARAAARISGDGLFTAPAIGGGYTVKATADANPKDSATGLGSRSAARTRWSSRSTTRRIPTSS